MLPRRVKDQIRRRVQAENGESSGDSEESSDSDESDSSSEDGESGVEVSDISGFELVRAAYDFDAGEDNELDLHVGDLVAVLEKHDSGYLPRLPPSPHNPTQPKSLSSDSLILFLRRWWAGQNLTTSKFGLFPVTYCTVTKKDGGEGEKEGEKEGEDEEGEGEEGEGEEGEGEENEGEEGEDEEGEGEEGEEDEDEDDDFDDEDEDEEEDKMKGGDTAKALVDAEDWKKIRHLSL